MVDHCVKQKAWWWYDVHCGFDLRGWGNRFCIEDDCFWSREW